MTLELQQDGLNKNERLGVSISRDTNGRRGREGGREEMQPLQNKDEGRVKLELGKPDWGLADSGG